MFQKSASGVEFEPRALYYPNLYWQLIDRQTDLGGAHSCWFISISDPEKVLFLHCTLTINTPRDIHRERREGGREGGTEDEKEV